MQITHRQSTFLTLGIIGIFGLLQVLMVWDGGRNGVFNSPDANANYYFARSVFEGKGLGMELPTPPTSAHQYLFTRSTRVVQNTVVPSGFTGIVLLYGFASRLFFLDLLVFWTIVAACAGMWAFYRMVSQFFSYQAGFLSIFLLAVHPAWWYYTNDSLLPNVLFVSFLFIAFSAIYKIVRSPIARWYEYGAVGAFLGIAFLVRSIEFIWILPILIFIAWKYRHVLQIRMVFAAIATAIFIIAMSVWYISLSSPLTMPFGYMVQGVRVTSAAGFGSPFAFHPRLILTNAWNYLMLLFWPYSLLTVISLFFLSRVDYAKLKILLYALVYIATALLLMYGSWRIVDSPDPNQVTIGTSYVRYFLPLYILMIPVFATGYSAMQKKLNTMVSRIVSGGTFFLLIVFMFVTAVVGSSESIVSKYYTLRTYDDVAGWILNSTPDNSVIIANKSDKYIWPHRLVVSSFSSPDAVRALGELRDTEGRPLYYVGDAESASVRRRMNTLWASQGIELANQLYSSGTIGVYAVTLRYDDKQK